MVFDNAGRGRHQVSQAAELITYRACLDLSWPAREKRNSVAGIPDIRLHTAPVRVSQMGPSGFVLGRPVRAVVARENHQGVARKTRLIERAQHAAERVIHRSDEIAV